MSDEKRATGRCRSATESELDRRTYLKLGASLTALTSLAGCGGRNSGEGEYGTDGYGAGEYGGPN